MQPTRQPKLNIERKKKTPGSGRTAKLKRYKSKGKAYGAWRVKHDGRELNLETTDAGEARKRWGMAKRGDYSWRASVGQATAAAFGGPPDATVTPPEPPRPSRPLFPPTIGPSATNAQPKTSAGPSANGPTPPAEEAPKGEQSSERVEAEYIPAGDWNSAVNDAARGFTNSQQQQARTMDPDAFARSLGFTNRQELMQFAGQQAAALQLRAQEWIIRKRGVEPGKVPERNPFRVMLANGWGVQIEQWMPHDFDVPLWALLLAAGGMCAIHQISTGTPIVQEEPEEPSDAVKPVEP